jgi:hypothetical protein
MLRGEQGVPVSEALLGIERLILDKKIDAAVVGNFRSEALLEADQQGFQLHNYCLGEGQA